MLITLAIIGVVAVLTIPTLVANYQQRGWNTSATVFERKLEESLKVMNTQGTLAGYKTTESFVNELQKHLKITKVCKNDDLLSCFEDTVTWGGGDADSKEVDMSTIKTSKNFGQDEWGTNVLGLQLANGTSALIAYNPDCKSDPYSNQITGTSCVAVLYDTSGYAKPNTSGKDLRSINVNKLGSTCVFKLNGKCFGAPFIPQPLTKAECEAENEIKFCYYDNDYWAGAVKACGGVNNLPNQTDIESLINEIYPVSSMRKETYNNGANTYYCPNYPFSSCWNEEKANQLSFDTTYYAFGIWGNGESSGEMAYDGTFSHNLSGFGFAQRKFNNRYAMCIAD